MSSIKPLVTAELIKEMKEADICN